MFGFLDLLAKRVNAQIAEYAATRSEIARRAASGWATLFQPLQPVRVPVQRRPRHAHRHLDAR